MHTCWFVFYQDGYHENGDVGLERCDSMEAAEKFIADRIAAGARMGETRTILQYTVIEGRELKIQVLEFASKVAIV
jgi:hypothetical protein